MWGTGKNEDWLCIHAGNEWSWMNQKKKKRGAYLYIDTKDASIKSEEKTLQNNMESDCLKIPNGKMQSRHLDDTSKCHNIVWEIVSLKKADPGKIMHWIGEKAEYDVHIYPEETRKRGKKSHENDRFSFFALNNNISSDTLSTSSNNDAGERVKKNTTSYN